MRERARSGNNPSSSAMSWEDLQAEKGQSAPVEDGFWKKGVASAERLRLDRSVECGLVDGHRNGKGGGVQSESVGAERAGARARFVEDARSTKVSNDEVRVEGGKSRREEGRALLPLLAQGKAVIGV